MKTPQKLKIWVKLVLFPSKLISEIFLSNILVLNKNSWMIIFFFLAILTLINMSKFNGPNPLWSKIFGFIVDCTFLVSLDFSSN